MVITALATALLLLHIYSGALHHGNVVPGTSESYDVKTAPNCCCRRMFMPQKYKVTLLLSALLLLLSTTYAQSLGDVARQQRQKEKDNPAPRKVITNDDIPESPGTSADPSPDDAHDIPSSGDDTPKKTGDQWKAEIQAQKGAVESLQSQIDKLKASIRFAVVTEYNNGYQWNQRQLKKQDQVERMQVQLEEQKKKLDDMQDDARKQGFGNSVYEPPDKD